MCPITREYDPFQGIPKGARILLAFSGGIDSTVAALHAKKAGFSVLAVHLLLLPGAEPAPRVARVASQLGIPLEFLNLSDDFRETVMRTTWNVYAAGRTPNPCTICNPLFKFGKLADFARKNGCAALATGHYARREFDSSGNPLLLRGADRTKDQSYFLYGLSDEQLAFACFPLGALEKAQIRKEALDAGFENAHDPESQDICFSQEGECLGEKLRLMFHGEAHPGKFVDPSGKVLGAHPGYHQFTPGQRKGTGIALGVPAYVREIRTESAEVVLTTDSADLMSKEVFIREVKRRASLPEGVFRADARLRYRSREAEASVEIFPDGTGKILFDREQRAVTPGQAAVIYDGDCVLCGGEIVSSR